MKTQPADSFQQPAVLGAGVMGGRIAALLANAGYRVKLYDRPPADPDQPANANPLAAIERLYQETPQPFSGSEAASLIVPRNYRDHWAELGEHDLIIETYANADDKRAWLTRLAPGFARDSVILSLGTAQDAALAAKAMPAGMRTQFLGLQLLSRPLYRRWAELFATTRTEERVLKRTAAFLQRKIGLVPAPTLPESPLQLAKAAAAAVSVAFHFADKHRLTLGEAETAVATIMGRQRGGCAQLCDSVGAAVICEAYAQLPADFQAAYPLPQAVQQGTVFYQAGNPPVLQTGETAAPDSSLQLAVLNGSWAQLSQAYSAACRFAGDFLRAYWQFIAHAAHDAGASPEDTERLHLHGFDWAEGPYQLLLRFGADAVFGKDAAKALPAGWRRKKSGRQKTAPEPAADSFIAACSPEAELAASAVHRYQDAMLVWQPAAESFDFDQIMLRDLLDAITLARRQRKALMMYHHGKQFGGLLPFGSGTSSQIEAEQQLLFDVIVALRMLPQPVMITVTGTVVDFGCAIMMQADRIVSTVDMAWRLRMTDFRLPPLGGIWFEWLRRLPRLSDEHARLQIHTVLSLLYGAGGLNSIHAAREFGIFRSHDRFVMTAAQLPDAAKTMADAWLGTGQNRPLRYPLIKPSADDMAYFAARAKDTANPELYLESVALLNAPNQGRILSLRRFLPAEAALYNRLFRQNPDLA